MRPYEIVERIGAAGIGDRAARANSLKESLGKSQRRFMPRTRKTSCTGTSNGATSRSSQTAS